jgi:NADPH-dependent ferric siderophore reductase
VRAAELPDGRGYAFVAGGQKLVSTMRRQLVTERAFPKESITFTGYWR